MGYEGQIACAWKGLFVGTEVLAKQGIWQNNFVKNIVRVILLSEIATQLRIGFGLTC